jgi:hypothetical protein
MKHDLILSPSHKCTFAYEHILCKIKVSKEQYKLQKEREQRRSEPKKRPRCASRAGSKVGPSRRWRLSLKKAFVYIQVLKTTFQNSPNWLEEYRHSYPIRDIHYRAA